MTQKVLVIGDPVQHRAWHWIAKVVEAPEGEQTHFSTFKLELPDGRVQRHALFSLISDEAEFIYDWSEFDEALPRRSKSKSKKSKH